MKKNEVDLSSILSFSSLSNVSESAVKLNLFKVRGWIKDSLNVRKHQSPLTFVNVG